MGVKVLLVVDSTPGRTGPQSGLSYLSDFKALRCSKQSQACQGQHLGNMLTYFHGRDGLQCFRHFWQQYVSTNDSFLIHKEVFWRLGYWSLIVLSVTKNLLWPPSQWCILHTVIISQWLSRCSQINALSLVWRPSAVGSCLMTNALTSRWLSPTPKSSVFDTWKAGLAGRVQPQN